jgi:hypothetical protein
MNLGPIIAAIIPVTLAVLSWIGFAWRFKQRIWILIAGELFIAGAFLSGYEISRYENLYLWSERRRDISYLLDRLVLENDTLLAEKLRDALKDKVLVNDQDYNRLIEISRDTPSR